MKNWTINNLLPSSPPNIHKMQIWQMHPPARPPPRKLFCKLFPGNSWRNIEFKFTGSSLCFNFNSKGNQKNKILKVSEDIFPHKRKYFMIPIYWWCKPMIFLYLSYFLCNSVWNIGIEIYNKIKKKDLQLAISLYRTFLKLK